MLINTLHSLGLTTVPTPSVGKRCKWRERLWGSEANTHKEIQHERTETLPSDTCVSLAMLSTQASGRCTKSDDDERWRRMLLVGVRCEFITWVTGKGTQACTVAHCGQPETFIFRPFTAEK